VIFLILTIAIVNLAMGIALALYFNPARGSEMELVSTEVLTPTTVVEDPTSTEANPPEELASQAEPVDENESPSESVADEDIEQVDPIERQPQRDKNPSETSIDQMRDHITTYWGLLCDLEGRIRAAGDSIEAEDISKLAAELITYNTEIDEHLDRTLDDLESQRDDWDDATHTIEQLLNDLRSDGQRTEAIDNDLGKLDPADDAQVAGEHLRTLLTRCLDRSYELRDRVESARPEILFDLGLLDDLSPDELLSPHTGVLNRLGIESTIRTWRQNESHSTRPYSLAVVCVDGLSELNKKLGTRTVDIVMGHVAEITLDAIRPSDCLGQYEGSKFLLFFPETGPSSATSYLEQMRQSLEVICFEHEGTSLNVTVSCGVVEGDADDAIDALALSAIETMEAARSEGGNRTLLLERGEPTQITPPDYGAEPRTIAL